MISLVKVLSELFIFSPQLFIYFAGLGLHCCAGSSLAVASGVYPLVAVHGLLIAVVFLQNTESRCAGPGGDPRAQELWLTSSRAQAQYLSHTGLVALRYVGSSRLRD